MSFCLCLVKTLAQAPFTVNPLHSYDSETLCSPPAAESLSSSALLDEQTQAIYNV